MQENELRQRFGGREVVFGFGESQSAHSSMEQFQRLVELAARCGATHILVGNLPYRTGS